MDDYAKLKRQYVKEKKEINRLKEKGQLSTIEIKEREADLKKLEVKVEKAKLKLEKYQ